MPNTSNLALPYPSLTDAPNVPSHIQALAGGIDTYLGGAWTSFAFTAADSVGFSTTGTTQANAYKLLGNKTMALRISITLTASNGFSGASPIELGPLPVGSVSVVNSLHGHLYRSTSVTQMVSATPSANRITRIYYTNGTLTGTAPWTWAIGDVLRLSGVVELQ